MRSPYYLPINPDCEEAEDPCKNPDAQSNHLAYIGPPLPCIGIQPCDTLSVAFQKVEGNYAMLGLVYREHRAYKETSFRVYKVYKVQMVEVVRVYKAHKEFKAYRETLYKELREKVFRGHRVQMDRVFREHKE